MSLLRVVRAMGVKKKWGATVEKGLMRKGVLL